jgi:hypothetical protein
MRTKYFVAGRPSQTVFVSRQVCLMENTSNNLDFWVDGNSHGGLFPPAQVS